MKQTASTCCYCGVGCGVLIEHDGQHIHNVKGDPAHPANLGRLCSKGSTLHLTGDLAARALHPELRLGKSMARSRKTRWRLAATLAARCSKSCGAICLPASTAARTRRSARDRTQKAARTR